MNIKLDWRSDFLGICAYDEKLYPNHFYVELQMLTQTEDARFQNVAFDRMKVLVTEIFAHSIFIGHENPNLETLIKIYPEKMAILPDEAYDQVIGMALFCKANAIMEGAIKCLSVRISSHFGDMVWYQFGSGEELGPFTAAVVKPRSRKKILHSWWNRPDLMTFDAIGDFTVTTWEELGLGWEDEADEEVIEVILDQPAEVIDMKKGRRGKFQAEVVQGGKNTDED